MEIENADLAQNATAEPVTTDDTNVPSLKSICVKVVGMHLNSIDNFGCVPWHIIKLVLEDKRCTPEILRRLENQSPHLKEQDQDIWRKFFFEKYPKKLDAFHNGEFAGTSNWQRLYDESARNDKDKFALAALRLRESKERKTAEKRERELQRTDKAPPPKRARWGETIPTRPKSLLEKARSQTMKATAVYRLGPSRSNSSPTSSFFARGSVSATPPAAVRRPSTASTISTASSSSAVSNVSSTSSRIAHLSSQIPLTPSAKSPSKSLSLASNNARPLGSSASTPIGNPPTPARSITEEIAEGSSSDPLGLESLIGPVSSTPVNVGGHFCDVFQGVHTTAGKVALKRPRISGADYDGDVIKRFEREAATWRHLRHPHILEFLGTLKRDGHLYLVSPFINNGTMVEYLFRHPNVKRVRLLRETADAIQYLHAQNVVHGDIKATNILISDDAHVLLCDFGLTKMIDSRTSTCVKGAGSVRWMSPELWDNEPRTFQSDVYAFGMTIAEVLTGQAPFPHLLTSMAVMMGVMGRNERPSKDPASSPDGESYEEAWNVGAACWPTNPSERISMAEAHRRLSTEYAASR